MDLSQNKICSIKVVRPVQKQTTHTHTSQQIYYDDYYIPTIYFPSFDIFGWLFRLLILIALIVLCLQGVFLALLIFFRIVRQRTYTCPKCKITSKIRGKNAPDRCEKCGADLNPPKCP